MLKNATPALSEFFVVLRLNLEVWQKLETNSNLLFKRFSFDEESACFVYILVQGLA